MSLLFPLCTKSILIGSLLWAVTLVGDDEQADSTLDAIKDIFLRCLSASVCLEKSLKSLDTIDAEEILFLATNHF